MRHRLRLVLLVLDAVFLAVALALNENGFGMVNKPIEDRGGDHRVVVEDGGPVLVNLVGGQNDGALFVTLADDLAIGGVSPGMRAELPCGGGVLLVRGQICPEV